MGDLRKRGVLVYPLKEEFQYGDDKYAVGINTKTSEVWMIHTEGVAYSVHHFKPWRFTDYSAIAPWYTVTQVLEMADYDNPVDLADWIREFGSRLESNFFTCFSALTAKAVFTSSENFNQSVSEQIINRFVATKRESDDNFVL